MKYLLALIFTLSIFYSNAQFGISVSYDELQAERAFNQTPNKATLVLPISNYSIAANYWFRLENKRVEFYPEVSFRNSPNIPVSGLEESTGSSFASQIRRSAIGLNFNTAIYLFDFAGDCNCPTFSKDGDFFKKGFFLEFSPGIHYDINQVDGDLTILPISNIKVDVESRDHRISYKVGIGAGIDIGVTDLFTLTPFFRYDTHFGNQWNLIEAIERGRVIEGDLNIISHEYFRFGLRLSLRPDYNNTRRRW